MNNDEQFLFNAIQGEQIKFVLEVGCGYPFKLIKLFHEHNANWCVGVDVIKEDSIVGCSDVTNKIEETSKLEYRTVSNLIYDCDPKREFHNSYKLFSSICLKKEPLDFRGFDSRIKVHFNKQIQGYLEINSDNFKFFNLIIVSKVLSHIEPNQEKNADWVYNELVNRLHPNGLIYVRVNSEDFTVDETSSIRHTYNEEKRNVLINHPDLEIKIGLTEFQQTGRNGKINRSFGFVGKKKTTTNNA
ncbi:MAG: hypothetical protein AB8H03_02470 [Saprospiraceae bacterium]